VESGSIPRSVRLVLLVCGLIASGIAVAQMVEGRVLGILFFAVGGLAIVVSISGGPLFRVEPRRAPNPVLVGVLIGGGMMAAVVLLFLL
jgi:hypothetical protein